MGYKKAGHLAHVATTTILLILATGSAAAELVLGSEEKIQAGGVDIQVPGYSVPSLGFWDGDHLRDLIVGEGSGSFPTARVRVYLNVGTETDPEFTDFFYAQSEGSDIIDTGGG